MDDTLASARTLALHEIKGVLTKFMRMLFPLEFRLDSFDAQAALPPFRYPMLPGEIIFLPDKIDSFASRELAFTYYKLVAAHLAARHEFGSFALRLSDLPEFEKRAEKGVEALNAWIMTFPNPGLAGAMVRLCETVRLQGALCRRYQGLRPDFATLNLALTGLLPPSAISTMLFLATAEIDPGEDPVQERFVVQANDFFIPLRRDGATVLGSVLQARELYNWLSELLERAEQAEGQAAEQALDDLTRSTEEQTPDQRPHPEQESEAEGGAGNTKQVQMQVAGRRARGNRRPLTAEDLRQMMQHDPDPERSQADDSPGGGAQTRTNLEVTQAVAELQQQLAASGAFANHGQRLLGAYTGQDAYFAYDEWDYVLGDYRRNWCRLREIALHGDDGQFYERTLRQYSELLPQVRRHFQRIRPSSYKVVRGLEDGEDFDLDRAVEHQVARLMGNSPDPRVYKARQKEARDVATLFLLDMSASTDEPLTPPNAGEPAPDHSLRWQRHSGGRPRPRRIIDVNKEALVIMAQALEELGDSYAIMGFSGHGRDNVEFYVIKEFEHGLSDDVRARIGAVEPKRSTRMGTAIRHVREKFKDVASRAKHVILLSDGFPQDFDYGHDRRSNTYGIHDTMVALRELELAGVMPFCITVDRTGHDYLRQMCQPSRYLVIEDITALPKELPKIYEQIVRW